jgi:multiple sugar transport system permease protein
VTAHPDLPRDLARRAGAPASGPARRRERWFYLLAAPWLAGWLLFQAGPILAICGLAFTEWRLPRPPTPAGLANWQALATDPLFGRSLANTLYYTAGSVPLGLVLGLGLALLLQRRQRAAPLFRAIFFLPVIVSGVATTLLWGWIFNPRFGLANALLALVGLRGPGWLQDEAWAMPALILMSLWGCGVNMLVFLAALQGVPAELAEAATLEGAAGWARFRHLTWPFLSPAAFYLLVVNVIGAFQVFTPTYLLTRGGPNHATLTLPLYIYFNAFAWGRQGYAAALALALLALVLALTLAQFALAGRWVFYRRELG